MFVYSALLLRVVDGDTVHLNVDLGFDVWRSDSFRLSGINAPEMSTPQGPPAKDHLVGLLDAAVKGAILEIHTEKDRREKYGRYLAELFLAGVDVNAKMIADGFAVPYSGGPRPVSS